MKVRSALKQDENGENRQNHRKRDIGHGLEKVLVHGLEKVLVRVLKNKYPFCTTVGIRY